MSRLGQLGVEYLLNKMVSYVVLICSSSTVADGDHFWISYHETPKFS